MLNAFLPSSILGQPSESNDIYHYFTYQEMTEFLHSLAQKYPDIMMVTSIGKTFQGRDIWMVKLSDNVSNDEREPGVLFMGAHHGNEKPSYEVPLFFIKYMVENYSKPNIDNDHDGLLNEDDIDGVDNDGDHLIDEDPSEDRVREVINTTQIYLIPMVNPDGVEADSRKNCAPNHGPFGLKKTITSYGVNLNRNYAYKWYLYYLFPTQYSLLFNMLDSSWNYRGAYPFSENETKAVKNFVETHDISISISYHTYGEFIVYPWTHSTQTPKDEPLFLSIGENISKINNYFLDSGGTYLIPRFGGTLGTSENWLYGEQGILAFTIELGSERAPTNPAVMYKMCLTHTGVHLYACERALTVDAEKIIQHKNPS
jgi:carboxypeptidase T